MEKMNPEWYEEVAENDREWARKSQARAFNEQLQIREAQQRQYWAQPNAEIMRIQRNFNNALNARCDMLMIRVKRRSLLGRIWRFPRTFWAHYRLTRKVWISLRLAAITLRSWKSVRREYERERGL